MTHPQHSEMTQVYVSMYEVHYLHIVKTTYKEKPWGESRKYTVFGEKARAQL